jgi:predicted regulator of Ras-like GTPase activity (Roadblock/LC7/MglB family)
LGTIVEHLRMLRDVHGVYGSFVVSESGSLVDRDLPEAFDDALFEDVGPRVARLFETFVSGGRDMETCMLRYAEHKLYIRKITWGIMAVVSSAAVNMPALRMVANLVGRRIDPETGPLSSMRPSPSQPPPLVGSPTTARPGPMTGPPPAPRGQAPSETPAPGTVVPVDGRDATTNVSDRHVRMYRGRPVAK